MTLKKGSKQHFDALDKMNAEGVAHFNFQEELQFRFGLTRLEAMRVFLDWNHRPQPATSQV